MRPLLSIIFFLILSCQVFSQHTGWQYGLVKRTDLHYWDNWDYKTDSAFRTWFTLNNCFLYNIRFESDGRLSYNDKFIATWTKSNDSVFLKGLSHTQLKRYYNLSRSYRVSIQGDTLILNTPEFKLYYLPCELLNGKPIFDSRNLSYRYLEWGVSAGVNYSRDLFYEFGISRSKLEDSVFYAGEVTFETNRKGVYGLNLTTYISSKSRSYPRRLGPSIIMGININTYSDLTHYNVGIKPLLGFTGRVLGYHFAGLQLMYGYNILFNKQKIENLNRHYFTLRYNLPIIRKPEKVFLIKSTNPWSGLIDI